ncbi:MAG: class I SAM-dependent methyltransferase [Candidatus Thorarchaeota archaeon]
MPDKKTWSYLQNSMEIDVGRYFEYDDDALEMYCRWLNFLNKPGMKVLEVGSGNGFFTNKLLKMFPEIVLSCLEPDSEFVEILQKRFANRISIINNIVESIDIDDNTFDAVISHIVIHNLVDPIKALTEMKRVIKPNGWLVTIEPLPASRHYYPSKEIEEAFDFLFKAKMFKCKQYQKELIDQPQANPWSFCYPQFFSQIGLTNIRSHGWTSIFTLSDDRFDFKERKNWISNRIKFEESKQKETKKILLDMGEKLEDIDKVYSIINTYFTKLDKATQEELKHIHEQEIVHRILTIGQKKIE